MGPADVVDDQLIVGVFGTGQWIPRRRGGVRAFQSGRNLNRIARELGPLKSIRRGGLQRTSHRHVVAGKLDARGKHETEHRTFERQFIAGDSMIAATDDERSAVGIEGVPATDFDGNVQVLDPANRACRYRYWEHPRMDSHRQNYRRAIPPSSRSKEADLPSCQDRRERRRRRPRGSRQEDWWSDARTDRDISRIDLTQALRRCAIRGQLVRNRIRQRHFPESVSIMRRINRCRPALASIAICFQCY